MEFFGESVFWVGLFAATMRLTAPLLFAATGELFAERAGVLNIGLEGMMLIGAWAAFMVANGTGSGWVGVLGAIAAGMFLGLIVAYLSVSRGANQMITGIVINIFALGFTSFVYRETFSVNLPSVDAFQRVEIPLLADIPHVGDIFFDQTLLVYLAFLLIPVMGYVLYRTQFGITVRAAGELPQSVDTAGVSVLRVRYLAMIVGGGFAGLAGAALSIGQLSQYADGLTAGRGFIALAIVLLGRWDPLKVLLATLLFAFADALQLRLQVESIGIPQQVLQMWPYILAIIIMTGFLGRARPPAQLAVPYRKEKS